MFGGPRSSIIAFVGVTLASAVDGIVTQRDKLETVCEDIRICIQAVSDQDRENDDPVTHEVFLKDLQLGAVIAKGCNAVVHSARWKNTAKDGSEGSESGAEVTVHKETDVDDKVPFNGYDLAVKMMFNYEAESNAPAILRAMHKEIVPARKIDTIRDTELFANKNFGCKKRLPAHPNIVNMQCIFTDSVPYLPYAMSLYPDALPKRLNRNGAGRNMTLFLVMKRYQCSLQDYLHAHDCKPRTRLLLLAQLLEGVVHLGRHRVAHRDLKADNILLDLIEGVDFPQMVIADFGCCLADDELGFKLPYYTEETDRGGNSALMAPEVACVRPGPYVTIDYDKADLWAVGALAYEIFGQKNPFYRSDNHVPRLDSRVYHESDLPKLPDNVHPVIERLVGDILSRNPRNRPTCTTAANVLNMLLFGPKKLVSLEDIRLTDADIVQWILTLTARTVIQRSVPRKQQKLKLVEQQLLTSFLRRVKLEQLVEAVNYFVL